MRGIFREGDKEEKNQELNNQEEIKPERVLIRSLLDIIDTKQDKDKEE
jgi:hypothetical protein